VSTLMLDCMKVLGKIHFKTVASLGLMSLGAATDNVTLFLLKKTDDLF